MKSKIKAFVFTCSILLPLSVRAECYPSFEKFRAAIDSDDRVLEENSKGFYIEEQFSGEDGSLADTRKLNGVPEKYRYQGRIFPSRSQQQAKDISLYLRRVVLNDVRVVTEQYKDGSEPSSYWFRKIDGCWNLSSRAVYID